MCSVVCLNLGLLCTCHNSMSDLHFWCSVFTGQWHVPQIKKKDPLKCISPLFFRLLREGMELLIWAAAGMWVWVRGKREAGLNRLQSLKQTREAVHMTFYSLLINHLIAWQTLSFSVTCNGFREVRSGGFTGALFTHGLFINKCYSWMLLFT